MNKVFYLGTCNTCKRIIQELKLDELATMQDIRNEPIIPAQLDEMRALTGSYETLFSRRSRQYAARGLKGKQLGEDDFRSLILEEDTFLKRPVVIYEGEIFVGSSKDTIENLKEQINS